MSNINSNTNIFIELAFLYKVTIIVNKLLGKDKYCNNLDYN